jgi:hypothetical protein
MHPRANTATTEVFVNLNLVNVLLLIRGRDLIFEGPCVFIPEARN